MLLEGNRIGYDDIVTSNADIVCNWLLCLEKCGRNRLRQDKREVISLTRSRDILSFPLTTHSTWR